MIDFDTHYCEPLGTNGLKRSVLAACNICFLKTINYIKVQKYFIFEINGLSDMNVEYHILDSFIFKQPELPIHFPFQFTFQISDHETVAASNSTSIKLFTHVQSAIAKQVQSCQAKIKVRLSGFFSARSVRCRAGHLRYFLIFCDNKK